MTYGFRASNGNIITVDENSTTYVYLGKAAANINIRGGQDIYIRCVGYPLIFLSVPYNTVNGLENGAAFGHNNMLYRAGVSVGRVRQVPGDAGAWYITVACNFVNGGDPGPIHVRVFGLLHLNFPNGSGAQWGARMRNQFTGQIYIDTGCRPLRLAGNTYDAEVALPAAVPTDNERVDAKDTSVTLPFDMAGKSVMANTRGTVTYPYYTGTYIGSDTQQNVDMYDVMYVDTLFWASGNALYARRAAFASSYMERTSGLSIVMPSQVVYSRLAIIDNNLFP